MHIRVQVSTGELFEKSKWVEKYREEVYRIEFTGLVASEW